MTRHHVRAALVLSFTLLAAACGTEDIDSTPSSTAPGATTTSPAPTTTTTESNLGGDRLPVQNPNEPIAHTSQQSTGTLSLDDKGCWWIDFGDRPRIAVFPEGWTKPAYGRGDVMANPQGDLFEDGAVVDVDAAAIPLEAFPGHVDGFWGSYLTFCDPDVREAAVLDTVTPAFDPSAVDDATWVEALRNADFTESWQCGFQFDISTLDQRIVVTVGSAVHDTPLPPLVELPDDDVRAFVTLGKQLMAQNCDDAVEGWEAMPQATGQWALSAGTLEIHNPPATDECQNEPPVTATLSGAVVDTPLGPVALPDLELSNRAYGCFAG